MKFKDLNIGDHFDTLILSGGGFFIKTKEYTIYSYNAVSLDCGSLHSISDDKKVNLIKITGYRYE